MQAGINNFKRQLKKEYDPIRKQREWASYQCLKHPEKVVVTSECCCNHKRKHLHHTNYNDVFSVMKLCPQCHNKIHKENPFESNNYSTTDLICMEPDQTKRMMLLAYALQFATTEQTENVESMIIDLLAVNTEAEVINERS